ncbi:hypothetical protein LG52_2263 [Geobacillus kaustophilus]|uniref:Uncharacterized protein n=1 Tax=Geobacillus kaustophilus TaxID=1462 RepID=A0A0D8BYN9_GEOKU|nr:hypothetical protein LG52_2263 [Geobacillus kaustophilus]
MKINRFLFPIDLQFFATDGGAGGGTASTGASPGGDVAGGNAGTPDGGNNSGGASGDNKGGEGAKTFTQDDVNRIIQKRLAEERTKWEKEFETKLTEAKTEAEKLAKMNAEQKAEYERKKREEELAKREAEITRRELRATALETLAEKETNTDESKRSNDVSLVARFGFWIHNENVEGIDRLPARNRSLSATPAPFGVPPR